MKRVKLSALLTVSIATITITSCGGGGGGDGISNNGYYQLSVQALPTTITPSVNISSMSIPADTWTVNFVLNSQSGAQATSGVITSASICFSDTTLPYQCMPVPITQAQISMNSTYSTTFSTSFYKLGAIALSTNPLQDETISTFSTTIPAYLTSNTSQFSVSSTSTPYEPDIQLSNGIKPGSVIVSFAWELPAQVSSTTITSSTTVASMSSGTYTVYGQCIDNQNGSFNTSSPYSAIACSGSIDYNAGNITNFSIADNNTITASYTSLFKAPSNTNSYTIITTYTVSQSSFNNYEYSGSASINLSYITQFAPTQSGSIITAYISPSITAMPSGLYVMNTFTPIGISIAASNSSSLPIPTPSNTSSPSSSSSTPSSSSSSPTSSGTIFYQCSASTPCSYSNGLFSITLPSAVSSSYNFYVVGIQKTQYSFNPNVNISSYNIEASIPYTFTANITLNTGQTLQATYNGTVNVFAP